MDTPFWVLAIGAAVSIGTLVFTVAKTTVFDKRLEELRAQYAESGAEKKARRDYEYEARKRLYDECEPILFQLSESSESAHWRILGICRDARNGELREVALDKDPYYLDNTAFRLFEPAVYYKIMRRVLTSVDLSLDPFTKVQYELTKQLYLSFGADHRLAREHPSLEYSPIWQWNEEEPTNAAVVMQQGIVRGLLDNALAAMITSDEQGRFRCISFSEFQKIRPRSNQSNSQVAVLWDLFRGFLPQTRPVLWRLIIVQVHIYRALARINSMRASGRLDDSEELRLSDLITPIDATVRAAYDWREANDQKEMYEQALVDPFEAAFAYLTKQIEQNEGSA